MRIITVGHRPPDWVTEGSEVYIKRLKAFYKLELTEIKAVKRHKNESTAMIQEREATMILQALHPSSTLIVLDERGHLYSTVQLANKLKLWQTLPQLTFLIGGPDGLSEKIRKNAYDVWSLSTLTFPHPLVRILVTEQLYRASTLLQNHPYHRE